MRDRALAVPAQTLLHHITGSQRVSLAQTLHGHCEDNGATSSGLAALVQMVPSLQSKAVVATPASLGVLNPGTSTELCSSSCQPFPVGDVPVTLPVSPGCRVPHVLPEERLSSELQRPPFMLASNCNLALTDGSQCSGSSPKLWSYDGI